MKARELIEKVQNGKSLAVVLKEATLNEGDQRYVTHKIDTKRESQLKAKEVKQALTVITAINSGMRTPHMTKTIDDLFEWLDLEASGEG